MNLLLANNCIFIFSSIPFIVVIKNIIISVKKKKKPIHRDSQLFHSSTTIFLRDTFFPLFSEEIKRKLVQKSGLAFNIWTVYWQLFYWECSFASIEGKFLRNFRGNRRALPLSRSDLQIYPGELPSARGNFICRGQIRSNCSSISRVLLEETSQKVGSLIRDSSHSWIIIFPIRQGVCTKDHN